jgi:class 3 adenylate cyclase
VSDEDLFGFGDASDDQQSLKENSEKILSTLKGNYKIYEDAEVFILVNANGEILLNKQRPSEVGEDVSAWPTVYEAKDGKGELCSDWWFGDEHRAYLPTQSEANLYSVTPFPIRDQAGIYGVLLIGFELGDAYAQQFEFEGEVPSYLNFIQNGVLLGSHLSESAISDLKTLLATDPTLEAFSFKGMHLKISLDGEEYIGRLSHEKDSLGQNKTLLFLKNFSQPLQHQVNSFLLAMLPWALMALLLTLLLSVMLAKRLTHPIKGLIGAVGRIGSGDFTTRVDVESRDEMGVLAEAFNEMGQDLETGKFIEGAMKQYVPSELVDDLKENQQLMDLGGDRQKVSIFFSDIVGFTSISERYEPEELIELLNRYLSEMATIVSSNKGTIDKFIGDAVMAFWNAPRPLEGHPNFAARTALEQLRFLKEGHLMKGFEKEGIALECRIGLHYGDAIVGNVGSDQRRDYTIIGDHVNLASRLEGANKQYGTQCMISESFRQQLDDDFISRPLDKIVVKGKTEPVTVYELIEEKNNLSPAQWKTKEQCTEMINRYWDRDFVKTISLLDDMNPSEPLVGMYRERCLAYLDVPPPKDWQGEWVLTTK